MNCRILIVEDEPKLREVLCDYLVSRGERPEGVPDGLQALERLAEERFDAVLLDIMMPGLDGLSVCRAVRRESDVPIVFLTALSDEEDKLLGYELGADDYVTKPFTLSVLYAKTMALIRRSRGTMRAGDRGAGPHPEGVRPAALPDAEPEPGHEPGTAAGKMLGLRLRGGGPGRGHPHQTPAGEAGRPCRMH